MSMQGRKVLNVLVLAALGAAAPRAAVLPPGLDATAAFERVKTLQGQWESVRPDGRKATTTFELTANGSVLLEHYSNPAIPGGGHMVTAYHLDGSSLILTHYCIARNQPTLRAERFDPATSEIQFEFLRATNLADARAGHMRRALYRIDDANHFTTSWEFFEGGAKKMTELERFTRVDSPRR
jgi:hypothetical protein